MWLGSGSDHASHTSRWPLTAVAAKRVEMELLTRRSEHAAHPGPDWLARAGAAHGVHRTHARSAVGSSGGLIRFFGLGRWLRAANGAELKPPGFGAQAGSPCTRGSGAG